MAETTKLECASQFLLAEFNSLQERARSYELIKSSRVNFFLVIVAAVGGIFTTISKMKVVESYFVETLLALSIMVLLLGLLTLNTLIDYSVAIVMFYRRAGRIRKWFVDLKLDIEKYIAFDATDQRPKFTISSRLIHWRGGESVLMLINCLAFSLIAGILIFKSINISIVVKMFVLTIIGILFWFLQLQYIHKKMRDAERSKGAVNNVNFPKK